MVEDFHFSSLHQTIEPLIIAQNVQPIYQGVSDVNIEDNIMPKELLKYTGSQLHRAQEILETEWKAAFPTRNLSFEFVDQNTHDSMRMKPDSTN